MTRTLIISALIILTASSALAVLPTRDEPVRTLWLIRHGEYEHGVDTEDEGGLVAWAGNRHGCWPRAWMVIRCFLRRCRHRP